MTKYLLLKHYRGAPAPTNDVPMDRWTPQEFSAHVQYMQDFEQRLRQSGEFVSADRRAGERNECEHASGTWGRLGEGDDRPEMIGKGEIRGPVTGPQDHE